MARFIWQKSVKKRPQNDENDLCNFTVCIVFVLLMYFVSFWNILLEQIWIWNDDTASAAWHIGLGRALDLMPSHLNYVVDWFPSLLVPFHLRHRGGLMLWKDTTGWKIVLKQGLLWLARLWFFTAIHPETTCRQKNGAFLPSAKGSKIGMTPEKDYWVKNA